MAINFPDATADGQIFEADTGVIYTYIGTPPNGYWSGTFGTTGTDTLDQRYVKLDDEGIQQTIRRAGLKFNNATTGDTIVLNPDGSAEFAGSVKIEDRANGTGFLSTTSVNNWSLQATQDSGNVAKGLYLRATGADGTRQDGLYVAAMTTGPIATVHSFGDFSVGTLGSPEIFLAADGSAEFAGTVTAESFVVSGGNGGGPGDAGDLHVTGDLTVDGTAEFADEVNAARINLKGTATENIIAGYAGDASTWIGSAHGDFFFGNLPGGGNIKLYGSDGSAQFGGDVIVGGNANNGTANGVRLFAAGAVKVSAASSAALFSGYTTGNSDETVVIRGDGSAEFSGIVDVGAGWDAGASNAGGVRLTLGSIYSQVSTSVGNNSAIYTAVKGTDQLIQFLSDGRATFAGDVVVGDKYDVSSGVGITLFEPSGAASVRVRGNATNAIWVGYQKDGGETSSITADGSAEFAGDVDAGSNGLTNSGCYLTSGGILQVRNDTDSKTASINLLKNGNGSGSAVVSMFNDGSASFAGPVETPQLVSKDETNDTWFYTNNSLNTVPYAWATKNQEADLWNAGVAKDGKLVLGNLGIPSGATITLDGSDGSASFAGNVNAKAAIDINKGGSKDGVSSALVIWNDSGSSTSVDIKGNGSAEFAGNSIFRGTLSVTGTGDVNGLYVGDSLDTGAVIKKDGSATFASNIQVGKTN